MRRLCNYLFLTFIFVFSSFAAEETSITTIKMKVSQMKDVVRILEENGVALKETAFFLDFDETLATTVGIYKINEFECHEFKFLSCPDRIRTYNGFFSKGFEGFSYNLDTFDFMQLSSGADLCEKYEVLDEGAADLVCKLCEYAYFAGVCSALPGNNDKKDLMKYVGLDEENYCYASQGKPQAIYGCLKEIKQPNKKITAVVLIDNSEKYAIDPFLEKMPALVKELSLSNVKIVGIEFTKFSDMVTPEAIREELTLLGTLLGKEGAKEGS